MAIALPSNQEIVYNKKNMTSVWKHLAFVIIIYSYLSLPYTDAISLIISGLIFFFFYLYITYKEVKVSSLWVTPISVFLLWNAINLGLSSAYLSYSDLTESRILFAFHIINIEALIESFKISLVGTFFFHLGMEKLKPTEISKVEKNIKARSLLMLFIFSIIYYFIQQNLLFVGSLLYLLKYGALASLSIYALTNVNSMNHSFKKKFTILLLGCFLIFIINISTMSKEEMMFAFLPVLWFGIKNKRARNYTVFLFLFLVSFYFLVVAPLSADLRYQYWKGMEVSTTESVSNIIDGKEKYLDPANKNKFDIFFFRSAQITPLAYLVDEVTLRGFMAGETLKYLAFSFVPRLFWPQKPSVTQSAWFTYYIGMAVSPEEATTSTGITAIGELYWNFGYLGVILGMLILGLGFSGLWRLAGNPLNSLISMILYIMIIFNMRGFSEFGSTIVAFVILFLIIKFLYKIRDSYLKDKKSYRSNLKTINSPQVDVS